MKISFTILGNHCKVIGMCFLLFMFGSEKTWAGTFTSNTASGNWNIPASWTVVGDADGVPDADDDVTIQSGHNITIATAVNNCRDLILDGTLTGISYNQTLNIFGDQTNNGTEAGKMNIYFKKVNGTISGTGSFNQDYAWLFGQSTSIAANVTTTRLKNCVVRWGITITNFGSVLIQAPCVFSPGSATSAWVNGAGSTLILRNNSFMAGAIKNFSTPGNTLDLRYFGTIVSSVGNIYENLILSFGGISLTTDITVEQNFTISGATNFNQNGNDITVSGNLALNSTGTFTQNASDFLHLDGFFASQTVSRTGGTAFTLRNLNIDNPLGVTFTNGSFALRQTLVLTNGDLIIDALATFTMMSDATTTARIDEITGTSVIIGNMVCQRFITGQGAGRDTTWADLSAPVQISTFADWDNELVINYSSGDDGTAYTFDEVADDFAAVSGPGQAIIGGQGYEMFLTDNFTLSSWSGATLTTIGQPNVGDQDLSSMVSFTPGNSNYNLVGNPFQSCINWASVFAASSNISNAFEYYDFTAGTYSIGGGSDEIPTGQGFWVLTTGSNPQFIVPESSKTTSTNSTLKSASAGLPYMTLALTSANGDHSYNHKLRVGTGAGSTQSWDFNDHPFRSSPDKKAPAIYATTEEGKKAVIYAFGQELNEVIIPLTIEVGISGDYKITASELEFVSGYSCVTLVDKTTGRTYDLNAQSEVMLENLQAGVVLANRFQIRLGDADCTSPEHITGLFENDFDVVQNAGQALVHFHYAEATPVTIHVTNFLGQVLVTSFTYEAHENTCTISLPSDFSGGYLITVMKDNEPMTKKLIMY